MKPVSSILWSYLSVISFISYNDDIFTQLKKFTAGERGLLTLKSGIVIRDINVVYSCGDLFLYTLLILYCEG